VRHDPFLAACQRVGGPIPTIGPMGESFRAGFYNMYGTRRGVSGSIQRAAWMAGRRRSINEPNALEGKKHG